MLGGQISIHLARASEVRHGHHRREPQRGHAQAPQPAVGQRRQARQPQQPRGRAHQEEEAGEGERHGGLGGEVPGGPALRGDDDAARDDAGRGARGGHGRLRGARRARAIHRGARASAGYRRRPRGGTRQAPRRRRQVGRGAREGRQQVLLE